ncbi:aspartic peptidase domain-containing protein [Clohesyomyces aquaticus]|uniref:Aspartic peptidase domain-containing protein n=1 Tax=Clohesyomyces aquaticus TaxID=1231657 RepID=A0A1Y1ZSM5_9PLEO|nr:aspartic peptidase domain-containing protein [Clohesyomyces aquaticus]
MYVINIGLGNPPLALQTQVDSSWGPLFRLNQTVYITHPTYNSSSPSTYQSDLRPCQLEYFGQAGIFTWGIVSQDSIHVGDVELKNQLFEEALIYNLSMIEGDDLFDTAVGLALYPIDDDWNTFPMNASSPFHSMVEQGLLDELLFGQTLGRPHQEIGELVLRGWPEDMDRDAAFQLPLTSEKEPSNDSFGNSSPAMDGNSSNTSTILTTQNTIAIISSSYPWIALHQHIADQANSQLGIRKFGGWVDCEKRAILPNLRVALGPEGQEIELTPWDYLIEAEDDRLDRIKCAIPFVGTHERNPQGLVILGSPLLNGLHSVFDAGRKSIWVANRPRPGRSIDNTPATTPTL